MFAVVFRRCTGDGGIGRIATASCKWKSHGGSAEDGGGWFSDAVAEETERCRSADSGGGWFSDAVAEEARFCFGLAWYQRKFYS